MGSMRKQFDALLTHLVPQKSATEPRTKLDTDGITPAFYEQPAFYENSPAHLDEMKFLRRENKTLKGQVKTLQQQIMIQVTEKEDELNRLKGILSDRCWMEAKDDSDEIEERRDKVNDLSKPQFSPRNVESSH